MGEYKREEDLSIFSKLFKRGGWEDLADEVDVDPYEEAVWAAPKKPDVVQLDIISLDDLSVPEELRGCRILERSFPDGTTNVIYQAPDGFCVDEQGANVLIGAYRRERGESRSVSPPPRPVVSKSAERPAGPVVSAPVRSVSPPPPPVVSQGSLQVRQDTVSEVLDTLPQDDSVPAKLRGASLVLEGGEVFYLTAAGEKVPKEQAEDWLEVWEKSMLHAEDSKTQETSEGGVARDDSVGKGGAPEEFEAPKAKKSVITPQEDDPWRLAIEKVQAQILADGERSKALDTGFRSGWAEEPVRTLEDVETTATGSASDRGWAEEPVRTVEDEPSAEGRFSFRVLVNNAGLFRDRIIKGEVRVLDDAFSSGDFIECLKDAVFERLSDERVERMLKHCMAGRNELIEAWKDYRQDVDRTMSGDLQIGRQVVIVLDSSRINDLDVRKMATLALLRSVDAKRDAVLRDLARGFRSSCRTDFTNYLMSRKFLDEWKWRLGNEETMVAKGSLDGTDVRQVLASLVFPRLEESLASLLQAVSKRHGLVLEFLQPLVTERFNRVLDGVAQELLHVDT